MNLHRLLLQRQAADAPIRVGLIGCGKFATMFLAQARVTPGLHVQAIADLDPARARENLTAAGWPVEQLAAADAAAARGSGGTWLTEDAGAVIEAEGVEVVVEATGDPLVGALHARRAIAAGRHVVMVNVEADVLCGPALAARAGRAGVVYSLAYGDQPALIAELVDWARTVGLGVVAAGKGTKYLPSYHYSTPDTVWQHYGLTAHQARLAGMNSKMFNSFLDGTKSAIEMAAVANATGLAVQEKGLGFPPCGVHHLPLVLRPEAEGGQLERAGVVEVVSSIERDGRPVHEDLRWGVYVTFEAPTDYTTRCFAEYGLVTDPSGRIGALWRPYHLIGLELGVSVASAALRREPTGCPRAWNGDVAAVAKRDLAPGEVLDGEGGFCVYGRVLPAARAQAMGALPLGFSKGAILARPVAKDAILTMADAMLDVPAEIQVLRNETMAMLAR
jgi:predicted homoserine dehydrogenase-like protein